MSKIVDSLIYLQDNALRNIHIDPDAIIIIVDKIKVLDAAVAYNNAYRQVV